MKVIDLSIAIEPFIPSDPPEGIPKIDYRDHQTTLPMFAGVFGLDIDDMPEKVGWATEFIQLSSHTGTHLDAPWHFFPTMNGGEPAWTIDQVPLEWCIGPGIILDFSDKADAYKLTVEDFKEALEKIDHRIQPGDIVLIRSGAADRWGTDTFMSAGCGVSREATHWLIDQGVHIVGTDAWSWDVPLPVEAEQFKENHDYSVIWESHRVGRDKAYCHIEKLANLDQVPPTGSTFCCFPVKIKGASAGWIRAVAILD